MELTDFNKEIAGTGYQFFPTKTKIRIENEDGDFLCYSSNIISAMKKCLPYGCGKKSYESLLKIAANELYCPWVAHVKNNYYR